MSRPWFLLLALSIGLNAGLISMQLSSDDGESGRRPPFPEGRSPIGRGFDFQPDPERLVEHHLARIAEQLELTDAQRDSIDATLREMVPQLLKQRNRMRDLRERIERAYRNPDLDPLVFRGFIRELADASATLDSLTAEVMLREASFLTPEQREAYMDTMPWGREGPHRGMGPGHRGRGLRPGGRPPGPGGEI